MFLIDAKYLRYNSFILVGDLILVCIVKGKTKKDKQFYSFCFA